MVFIYVILQKELLEKNTFAEIDNDSILTFKIFESYIKSRNLDRFYQKLISELKNSVIITENTFSVCDDSQSVNTTKTKASVKLKKRRSNKKKQHLSNSSKYKLILENYKRKFNSTQIEDLNTSLDQSINGSIYLNSQTLDLYD